MLSKHDKAKLVIIRCIQIGFTMNNQEGTQHARMELPNTSSRWCINQHAR